MNPEVASVPRPRWRGDLSLRSRLLLLVVASVVPLVGMGLVREYLNFKAERREIDAGLLLTARGMALSVERDLQLNVSSLETLATSLALQSGDLATFKDQASGIPSAAATGFAAGRGQPGSVFDAPVRP